MGELDEANYHAVDTCCTCRHVDTDAGYWYKCTLIAVPESFVDAGGVCDRFEKADEEKEYDFHGMGITDMEDNGGNVQPVVTRLPDFMTADPNPDKLPKMTFETVSETGEVFPSRDDYVREVVGTVAPTGWLYNVPKDFTQRFKARVQWGKLTARCAICNEELVYLYGDTGCVYTPSLFDDIVISTVSEHYYIYHNPHEDGSIDGEGVHI